MSPWPNIDDDLLVKINSIKMNNAISLYKTILVSYALLLEILNEKLYPKHLYFKNFACYISKNMDTYENIFIDIYDKYKLCSIEFSPEVRLVMKTILDSILNKAEALSPRTTFATIA